MVCLMFRDRRCLAAHCAAIMLVAALFAPFSLAAQVEDVTPPTIIMPVTGSYTTASIVVTIQFVDSSLIVQQSMVETINGTNVTSGFSWSQVHHCPQMTCGWTVTSVGTIHLVPGSNTFHVEICDNEANCSAKDGHYTYTPPPPPQELSVTPTYETLEAERSFSYVEHYTITNGSTQT